MSLSVRRASSRRWLSNTDIRLIGRLEGAERDSNGQLEAILRPGRNYKILRPPPLQNSQNPTVAMPRKTPATISGMPMLLNILPPIRRTQSGDDDIRNQRAS